MKGYKKRKGRDKNRNKKKEKNKNIIIRIGVQWFKCLERGHYSFECPHKKIWF